MAEIFDTWDSKDLEALAAGNVDGLSQGALQQLADVDLGGNQPKVPQNFAVRGPALPPSASQAINQRAAELAAGGKKDVLTSKAATELAESEAGKQLSEDQTVKFGAQNYMIDLLKQIAETKNKGFSAKGKGGVAVRAPVDTGPVASLYPNAVSAWYNRKFDNQNPWDSTARARLEQLTTKVINPERKDVTGASAAESEIANWIAPTMPRMNDDDDVFNAKLVQAFQTLAEKNRAELASLREQGYRVPGSYDVSARIPEFMGVVPKKYQVMPKGEQ